MPITNTNTNYAYEPTQWHVSAYKAKNENSLLPPLGKGKGIQYRISMNGGQGKQAR